jgi:hypothetical protein
MRAPIVLLGLLAALAPALLHAQFLPPDIAFPLPIDQDRSAATRRARKPPEASRLVDDMENLATWSHFGPGRMTLTSDRALTGSHSLRLSSPTKLDKPGPVPGRPFADTGVRRSFPAEDWRDFNRLSFHVFPHLPGFNVISLLVKFHNEDSDRWSYTFGHLHHVILQPDRWNHVVWEIPHLPRARVTAIDLVYRLQGNEPNATNTVRFDFDDLRLERVRHPDPFLGWEVHPGDLAYNHLGYTPDATKTAIGPAGLGSFEVIDTLHQTPAFRGLATPVANDLGRFSVLDFTPLRQPGRYRLQVDGHTTHPFTIGHQVWNPAWIATLNQYACQRCGDAVPGIHQSCHKDWQVTHQGRSLPLAGGWHDAGDLSQGLANTAEATLALLAASETLPRTSPHLPLPPPVPAPGRWFAEARHGLDWILRTRFDDGFRAIWATMDFWTDGVRGNADDVTVQAGDAPFETFLATAAAARAARLLQTAAPETAARILAIAHEDWRRASARLDPPRTEWVAAAINAALELHHATPEPTLEQHAIELGRLLMAAQRTEPNRDWTLPLTGYFHTGPDRRRILRYNHRGHDDAPIVALAGLLQSFPHHPDAPAWRNAISLHARYLRQTAEITAPWFMPAAGIHPLEGARPEEQRQIRQGFRLDDQHYLRRFPIWGDFRGNSGVLLSQARAWSAAARALHDPELAQYARNVLDWHLGRNPFAQSLMYGVGHAYTPQYSAMSGDIAGGLPVGIQTRLDDDSPYWPSANCYNFAEIWIHPSTRFLAVLNDLHALATSQPSPIPTHP